MRWHAVDLVVGRHHAHDARLRHRRMEGHQEVLAKDALGDVHGSDVGPALGLAVRRVVLRRRDHMLAVDARAGPLQRLHDGNAHARDEERVLAVRLVGATPARLAAEVEVRAEHLMAAARPHLERRRREDARGELRVPRARERERLREVSALRGHLAMERLVVKDRRDTEPRVLDQPSLDGVRKGRRLARALSLVLARDLPDAVLHHHGRALGREVAAVDREVGLRSGLRPLRPQADELRDLLLERHARQQVRDAPLDRKPRVLVLGRGRLRLPCAGRDRNRQAGGDGPEAGTGRELHLSASIVRDSRQRAPSRRPGRARPVSSRT